MDYGRVFEEEESKKLYEQMLKRSRKHKDNVLNYSIVM